MDNITAVVLTKNEEDRIVDTIKNIQKLTRHIVVVDSGSTDDTVKLAESNGAKVMYRAWDNDFAAQRNFALQHVKTEWILYLDADEHLNKELIEDIKYRLAENKNEQYSIKRKSVAFGKEFNHGVLKPDFVPRIFKTNTVKWTGKVHERPLCDFPVKILNGHIRHYTYKDWHQYFNKFNQYTTIWAQNAYENNKKTNFLTAIVHGIFGFVQMAFLKKGVLDGYLGLILSINHFGYVMMKYVKLIDLQRKDKR